MSHHFPWTRRGTAGIAFALTFFCSAGAWSQTVEWVVSSSTGKIDFKSWGTNCGERPKPKKGKLGTRYRQEGTKWNRIGKGKALFAPGVCRAATGLRKLKESRRGNKVTCASPKNSSTAVHGVITLTSKGSSRLAIEHSFEYEWRLYGSHCHMVDSRRWFLEKPAQEENVAKSPSTPAKSTDCDPPGPPIVLVPRGSTSVSVVGGRTVRLRVDALDENGCKAKGRIRWATKRGRISRSGNLNTRGIPAGTTAVTARLGKLAQEFKVRIIGTVKTKGLAPNFPLYNPNTDLQVEDRQPLLGIVVGTTVKEDRTAQAINLPVVLTWASFGLGLILFIMGFRKRRQSKRSLE